MKLLRYTVFLLLFLPFVGKAQHEAVFNTKIITTYNVRSIPGLNTAFSEFSPLIAGERLVFVSDRDFDYLNWGENRWKKRKFMNVFSAGFQLVADSAKTQSPVIYSATLVGQNHSGPIAISPDGATIVFTQVGKKRHTVNRPQLYLTRKVDGKWSNPQLLSFCDADHSYGHPAFSMDGNVLFFSSDREGTKGGKDIFYSRLENDAWGMPENAGVMINTSGDEVFPFVHENVLYFSSNCSGGNGELDIYKSYFRDLEFTPAENLGETINSSADDFGITIAKNGKTGFISSNREGGKGSDDIYFIQITETAVVESKDLQGRFSYRNLDNGIKDLDVLLIDDSGRVVLRVRTNENGEFAFRNLPVSDNYSIKLVEPSADLKLEIFDKNGEAIAVLRSDQNGKFLYKKLDAIQGGMLTMMEEEEPQFSTKGRLNGQFIFENDPNKYPDGLNVYLMDNNGNVKGTTKTDNRGNFSFRQLDLGDNYIIRTDSLGDDAIMLIYNKHENVIAEYRRDKNGNYVFRKLGDRSSDLSLMDIESDSATFAQLSVSLNGQFRFRSLDGTPSDMSFFILDDDGNLIYKGKTDENGHFRARNLAVADQYIFQIDPNDPNYDKKLIVELFARNGKSLAVLENDKSGKFVYKRLKQEFSYIKEIKTEEVQLELPDKIPYIYFEKNSSYLDEASKKQLDKVVQIMRKVPHLKIEISAHADSRADDEFNDWLTEKRMNRVKDYLIDKGIPASRITGAYYGKRKPVNSCSSPTDCDEDQHRQNRRCELRLIPAKA
ncbi:MAG TPA: OmpA family protein [Flavobacteriales bacterium]|nr:OmpA family protein [Flavobacteriales bacterium]HRE96741.1 OmpA family protein [Flavobacteriales bacterium]HRJ37759.1 OmpA family protein [Flavobacteriales bacterium]